MALPTEKTNATVSLAKSKTLIYGPPKVGKTTLAAELAPNSTLFLATEPGHGAIEAFVQPITRWEDYLEVVEELGADTKFKIVVIDTVDELLRMCADYVTRGLAGGGTHFVHASDFEYGKGWDAVTNEWRLRIGALAHRVEGVIFLSHVKEEMVKERNGLEVSKMAPAVGMKGPRQWLLGFVDFIFAATIVQTTEGDQRQLQLAPTETHLAGARMPVGVALPDAIPLSAGALKKAFRDANKPAEKEGQLPTKAELLARDEPVSV